MKVTFGKKRPTEEKKEPSVQQSNGRFDNVYRGNSNYYKAITQGDTLRANAGSTKNRIFGPQKSSAFIRTSVRVDYAPDLCKDYNETGYCVFGDNCKFLHDRGEYKAGWQLDKEWEEEQEQEKKISKIEKELALKETTVLKVETVKICGVCGKEEMVRPVMTTNCQHLFCESCFLNAFKVKRQCPTCKQPSSGQLTYRK